MEMAKIITELPSGEGDIDGHLAQSGECLPTEFKSLDSQHTAMHKLDMVVHTYDSNTRERETGGIRRSG